MGLQPSDWKDVRPGSLIDLLGDPAAFASWWKRGDELHARRPLAAGERVVVRVASHEKATDRRRVVFDRPRAGVVMSVWESKARPTYRRVRVRLDADPRRVWDAEPWYVDREAGPG